jgi:hypothetical protein
LALFFSLVSTPRSCSIPVVHPVSGVEWRDRSTHKCKCHLCRTGSLISEHSVISLVNLAILAIMAVVCGIADSKIEQTQYAEGAPWLYGDNVSYDNPKINGLITWAFALITLVSTLTSLSENSSSYQVPEHSTHIPVHFNRVREDVPGALHLLRLRHLLRKKGPADPSTEL